jgi:hypothetical protein
MALRFRHSVVEETTMAKQTKKDVWKQFSEQEYQTVMKELVHFSAKTTNSNALPIGIRLPSEAAWSGNYVAVSTLLAKNALVVDYFRGANVNKASSIIKQIAAVCYGEHAEDFIEIPEEDAAMITRLQENILSQAYLAKQTRVPMRLRQIIVQNQAGEDIVLTPLQSASLSHLLQDKLRKENRFRPRGFLDLGGSNKQNIGRYVRDMTRPLFFQAPQEDSRLSQALAIHYRGISLKPSLKQLSDYQNWRLPLITQHGGAMPSDLSIRDIEREKIQEVVKNILQRAEKAKALLSEFQALLPDESLTAASLEPVQRALLDKNQHYANWKDEVAKALHQEILKSRILVNGELQFFPLGEQETSRWIDIIKEIL